MPAEGTFFLLPFLFPSNSFFNAGTFHTLFLFEEPVKPHLMSARTKNFVTQINEIVFLQLLHFQHLDSFSLIQSKQLFSKCFHTANALPYDSILHHLPELFV